MRQLLCMLASLAAFIFVILGPAYVVDYYWGNDDHWGVQRPSFTQEAYFKAISGSPSSRIYVLRAPECVTPEQVWDAASQMMHSDGFTTFVYILPHDAPPFVDRVSGARDWDAANDRLFPQEDVGWRWRYIAGFNTGAQFEDSGGAPPCSGCGQ